MKNGVNAQADARCRGVNRTNVRHQILKAGDQRRPPHPTLTEKSVDGSEITNMEANAQADALGLQQVRIVVSAGRQEMAARSPDRQNAVNKMRGMQL